MAAVGPDAGEDSWPEDAEGEAVYDEAPAESLPLLELGAFGPALSTSDGPAPIAPMANDLATDVERSSRAAAELLSRWAGRAMRPASRVEE